MKSFLTTFLLFNLCIGAAGPGFSQENENPDRPKSPKEGRPDFPDLSPEQMRRVREVMGKVWNSPEVSEAREQWQKAGEAYRKALKEAVLAADPEVAALMDKMHEGSRMRAHQKMHPGMRPGLGPGGPNWPPKPDELVSRMLKSEPVMETITVEQRGELFGFVQQLLKSGELESEIKAVVENDNPEKHFELRTKLREAMVSQLSSKAEWIEEAFENAPPPSERIMRGGPGAPGGPPKGKGKGGKGKNNGERPKRPETE